MWHIETLPYKNVSICTAFCICISHKSIESHKMFLYIDMLWSNYFFLLKSERSTTNFSFSWGGMEMVVSIFRILGSNSSLIVLTSFSFC